MASKKKVRVHPGKVLRDEFMARKKVFANEIVMEAYPLINWATLWSLLRGESDVDQEMAEGLALVFKNSPSYWLDLQRRYNGIDNQETIIAAAS